MATTVALAISVVVVAASRTASHLLLLLLLLDNSETMNACMVSWLVPTPDGC